MDEQFSIKKSFVSREVLDESRKEEWDKVRADAERQEDLSVGESEYDPRTLYERLQEQKMRKEEAFAEATRFSNLIKRIDEDEFEYLKTLEDSQLRDDLVKRRMEQEELDVFRRAVEESRVAPPAIPAILPDELLTSATSPPSAVVPTAPAAPTAAVAAMGKRDVQKSILRGAVIVRKRSKDAGQANGEEANGKDKEGKEEEPVGKKARIEKGKENDKKKVNKEKEKEKKNETNGQDNNTKSGVASASATTVTAKPLALASLLAYSDDDEEKDEDEWNSG